MDFYDILEHIQVKSILFALSPNDQYIWRRMCREYSEKFHTALDRVHQLDPEFVLTNLFEEEFSTTNVKKNLDEILDRLYRLRDPNYEVLDDAALEDLVDAVLSKEMKRKGEVRNDPKLEEPKPTQGAMNFSGLDHMDEIAERGKSGFKD